MQVADVITIASYEERKAAVMRAAMLIASTKGSDEDREFDALTLAIADFDIAQEAEAFVELPSAFIGFLGKTDRHA
jgi:hypothetical protein